MEVLDVAVIDFNRFNLDLLVHGALGLSVSL
jgi:hypothetical protein